MYLLGLSCSPRQGGNTDLLLDEFLRGASEQAATAPIQKPSLDNRTTIRIEKLYASDLNIQPCTQCDYCATHGTCNIQDDMQILYPKLLEADGLVLAAPIFFMFCCAQAKIIIDRCQVFWARQHYLGQELIEKGRPLRRGVFISVGATHGPKVFAGSQVTMKWFFHTLQMQYWGNLLFEGLDAKSAVLDHTTALKEAYGLGGALAQADGAQP